MLVLLAAFAVLPLALPWLYARIGPRAFLVAALLPVVAFGHALTQTGAVIAGDTPEESLAWIRSSASTCRCAWTRSAGS